MTDIKEFLGYDYHKLSELSFDDDLHKKKPETPEDMNDFYKNQRSYLIRQDVVNKSERYIMAKRYILLEILKLGGEDIHRGRRFAERITPKNIVDYGGAAGNLCVPIAELGYTVHYVEVKNSQYAKCFKWRMKRRGLDNYTIYGHEDELPKEKMDAVICWDVLEHCTDVPFVLENIKNCLKKGGLMLLEYGWHERKEYPVLYKAMQEDDKIKEWLNTNFKPIKHNCVFTKK